MKNILEIVFVFAYLKKSSTFVGDKVGLGNG